MGSEGRRDSERGVGSGKRKGTKRRVGSVGRRESEELKENEGIGRGSRVCHTCCSALHRIYTVLFCI